jgi:hypothetical protein
MSRSVNAPGRQHSADLTLASPAANTCADARVAIERMAAPLAARLRSTG